MYESPIKMIQDEMSRQIRMDMENNVMKAVMRYDIEVDKEELLQALKYDRQQYEKGYSDGKMDFWWQGYKDGLNANRWIPCSERLPELGKAVITSDYGYLIRTHSLSEVDEKLVWEDCEYGYWSEFEDISAWMPLPEPYRGEDNGKVSG